MIIIRIFYYLSFKIILYFIFGNLRSFWLELGGKIDIEVINLFSRIGKIINIFSLLIIIKFFSFF